MDSMIEILFYHFAERLPRIEESNKENEVFEKFENSLTEEQKDLFNEFYMTQSERHLKEFKRFFRLGFTECINMFLDGVQREKTRY